MNTDQTKGVSAASVETAESAMLRRDQADVPCRVFERDGHWYVNRVRGRRFDSKTEAMAAIGLTTPSAIERWERAEDAAPSQPSPAQPPDGGGASDISEFKFSIPPSLNSVLFTLTRREDSTWYAAFDQSPVNASSDADSPEAAIRGAAAEFEARRAAWLVKPRDPECRREHEGPCVRACNLFDY